MWGTQLGHGETEASALRHNLPQTSPDFSDRRKPGRLRDKILGAMSASMGRPSSVPMTGHREHTWWMARHSGKRGKHPLASPSPSSEGDRQGLQNPCQNDRTQSISFPGHAVRVTPKKNAAAGLVQREQLIRIMRPTWLGQSPWRT